MNYKLLDQLIESFIAKGFEAKSRTDYVTDSHIVRHNLLTATAKSATKSIVYTIDIAEEYAGEITYVVLNDNITKDSYAVKPQFGIDCDDIIKDIIDAINGEFMIDDEDYELIKTPVIQKHRKYKYDGDQYITYYYIPEEDK